MNSTATNAANSNADPARSHVIVMDELAQRIRWRRYWLAQAASNPYLERPSYRD